MSNIVKQAQLPVQYEEAVKALDACLTIDEAKYWSDKADALAAWAKIYRNDVAGRRAKQLKLHAYRRMGILAEELRPTIKGSRCSNGVRGPLPGARSLLFENGLSVGHVDAARKLSQVPQKKFDKLLQMKNVPGPTVATIRDLSNSSANWKTFGGGAATGTSVMGFRSFCRRHKAKELARSLVGDEIEKAQEIATECAEWLDEFLYHLPKQKRGK